MPNVTIDGPVITDLDKKRKLVRDITSAMKVAYPVPEEAIVVVIRENGPENVGVGGALLLDRFKNQGST
jgi:4-oxalocrotonate tautomerase